MFALTIHRGRNIREGLRVSPSASVTRPEGFAHECRASSTVSRENLVTTSREENRLFTISGVEHTHERRDYLLDGIEVRSMDEGEGHVSTDHNHVAG